MAASVLNYLMPPVHWAMPSKHHSIHRNDLARAMVAQSEQAILAMAQENAPKGATSKILEYMGMSPSSSRASTRGIEQQQSVCVEVKCFGVCYFTGVKVTSRIIVATGRK